MIAVVLSVPAAFLKSLHDMSQKMSGSKPIVLLHNPKGEVVAAYVQGRTDVEFLSPKEVKERKAKPNQKVRPQRIRDWEVSDRLIMLAGEKAWQPYSNISQKQEEPAEQKETLKTTSFTF